MNAHRITPEFSTCGPIGPSAAAAAARLGYRTIISLRPDGEAEGQASAAALCEAVHEAGLQFVHIPARAHELFTDPVVGSMRAALQDAKAPFLASCATGQRAAVVWAAASTRSQSVDDILALLARAGFDFGFLRDDLEAQSDRAPWLPAKGLQLERAIAA